MKLLVTTSQSLLLVDTDSMACQPLDRGRGLYYGIAHADGKLFVASRKRGVSPDTERDSERGQILVFDQRLRRLGSLRAPFPLRDLHEIAWHQGKLYASCSHDNMVAIYDGANWEQWFPLGGSLEDDIGPGDINHFNSFFFEDERIWVLAHNRGASELLAFSSATRELLERVDLGNSAHNIWREAGQLFTCSSIDGKLVGDRGFMLDTGGFPRGVAFDDKVRCLGISAMAERKARDFTTGKLAVYDRDWQLTKEIVLQDEGLILDLHVLPPGFSFEPVPDLAELPEEQAAGDSFYRFYEDRNRGSRELIKSRLKAYRPFFEPWLTREPAPQALDLGCGRGEWMELLRDAGFAASGVDLDAGMLRGLHRLGLDARHADALQALREAADASMAIVSAFHVVEHIPFEDVRTLVREAMRVLKPGGLLILETPNPENLVVGSSLFYQDPSHLRPLPPELLRFVVHFEGFERHAVTRLQEAPSLHTASDVALINVLGGVSPDYAVVGQKKGDARFLQAFDPAFERDYGVTLPALAHRYETQERRRVDDLAKRTDWQLETLHHHLMQAHERITQLDAHLHELDRRLATVFASPTWKLTAPLRWLGVQAGLMKRMGPAARFGMAKDKLRRRLVRAAGALHPQRSAVGKFLLSLAKATGLYGRLKSRYARLVRTQQSGAPFKEVDPEVAGMSARSADIYRGLKAAVERNKESH